MKLYYAPGACSQAAHIVLHEAGLPHDSEAVDIRGKKTADGGDYFAVNPKGAVPALRIGDDEVLTENGAVLLYLGDKSAKDALLPADGLGRYRVVEWVSYLASDVHKSFGPLFNPGSSPEVKQAARDMVGKKLDYVEKALDGRDYLMGRQPSIADPYLFAMLGWLKGHDIDISRWPNLAAFRERMMQRPAVQKVLKAEGLA